jgi:Na+-translocating ferredoxin:NAD+ oxidoreductase RnfD subunit
MTLLLVTLVLASELPDPGKLATAGLASLFGGFVGGGVGRCDVDRASASATSRWTAVCGFGVGFIAWLIGIYGTWLVTADLRRWHAQRIARFRMLLRR